MFLCRMINYNVAMLVTVGKTVKPLAAIVRALNIYGSIIMTTIKKLTNFFKKLKNFGLARLLYCHRRSFGLVKVT